jgi:hypothetical protein
MPMTRGRPRPATWPLWATHDSPGVHPPAFSECLRAADSRERGPGAPLSIRSACQRCICGCLQLLSQPSRHAWLMCRRDLAVPGAVDPSAARFSASSGAQWCTDLSPGKTDLLGRVVLEYDSCAVRTTGKASAFPYYAARHRQIRGLDLDLAVGCVHYLFQGCACPARTIASPSEPENNSKPPE